MRIQGYYGNNILLHRDAVKAMEQSEESIRDSDFECVRVCDYKLDARRQDMVALNDSFLEKKFIAAVKHEGGGV